MLNSSDYAKNYASTIGKSLDKTLTAILDMCQTVPDLSGLKQLTRAIMVAIPLVTGWKVCPASV